MKFKKDFKDKQSINKEEADYNNINPFNPIEIKRYFFSWIDNSCRLDSSFFIFAFIIFGYSNKKDLNKKNYAYLLYIICNDLIELETEDLRKEYGLFWIFIKKI